MKRLQIYITIAFVQGIAVTGSCPKKKTCSDQSDCVAYNFYCTQCHSNYSEWRCQCRPGYKGGECEQVCSPACDSDHVCSIKAQSTESECRCSMENCENDCGKQRNGTGSGYYFEMTCEYGTQYEAKDYCESRGGWLAEPKTGALTNDIKTIVKGLGQFVYVGLERNNNGTWQWRDGTNLTDNSYTNWKKNEMENGVDTGGNGSCIAISQNADWFDWECGRTELFLCQYGFCEAFPHTCQNGGECVDNYTHIPYYNCICMPGYYGQHCESVYGVPEKFDVVAPNCSASSEVIVKWTPDERTKTVDHKFSLLPNDTAFNVTVDEAIASGGKDVTLNGLDPETEYQVQVVVCPHYGCIRSLNRTEHIETGIGLPAGVVNPNLTKGESEFCEVMWEEVQETLRHQVLGYTSACRN